MGAAFRRFLLKLAASRPLLHRVACETSSCEDSAVVAVIAAATAAAYAGGRLVGLQGGEGAKQGTVMSGRGRWKKLHHASQDQCPRHPTVLTSWL